MELASSQVEKQGCSTWSPPAASKTAATDGPATSTAAFAGTTSSSAPAVSVSSATQIRASSSRERELVPKKKMMSGSPMRHPRESAEARAVYLKVESHFVPRKKANPPFLAAFPLIIFLLKRRLSCSLRSWSFHSCVKCSSCWHKS